MTYKTCKILTRLKTAPHVSVARRMEPFAKHLLHLASWLELYPSQASVSALLPAVWGWWKLAVFRKTRLCHGALPLLCLLSPSSSPAWRHSSQGSCSPAGHSAAHRGLSYTECTQSISVCPAPFFGSSSFWEQSEKLQEVNLLTCALYQQLNLSHLIPCKGFLRISSPQPSRHFSLLKPSYNSWLRGTEASCVNTFWKNLLK